MRAGEGAAHFLADLAEHVSDAEMRRKWVAGSYGALREQDVKGWRRLAGRI
jgi:hypothetical protein